MNVTSSKEIEINNNDLIKNFIIGNSRDLKLVSRNAVDSPQIIVEFDKNKKPKITGQLKDFLEKKEIECIFNNCIKVNTQGVYCFYARKRFDITLEELFKPFIYISIKDDKVTAFLLCVPKINLTKGEKEKLKQNPNITINQGELIYVGEAENIKTRYKSHMNDRLNKTSSLKLGLREKLSSNIEFFYIPTSGNISKSELEKFIRENYYPLFGE